MLVISYTTELGAPRCKEIPNESWGIKKLHELAKRKLHAEMLEDYTPIARTTEHMRGWTVVSLRN